MIEASALSWIQSLDIPRSSESFRSADPFPNMMVDNFLVEDFAHEIADAFPSFQEASQLGKGFHAVNERNKYQIADASVFPAPIRELNQLLASPAFLDAITAISGINGLLADKELAGGGIHQTGPRGHLDVHVDFNYIRERLLHRRLNILIFFNREWPESWGGRLELWDSDVKDCHHSFLPIFNRCVMFETSDISYHGVTAVTCPSDASRKSFAAYYYTPTKQIEGSHSTIFRARPNERLKRYFSMPSENFARMIMRGQQKLKDVVKKCIGRT